MSLCPNKTLCPNPDQSNPLTDYSARSVNPAKPEGRCLGVPCPDNFFGNYSSERGGECDFDPVLFQEPVRQCLCAGDDFRIVLCAPGLFGPWTWTVLGELPIGVGAAANHPGDSQMLLDGTLDAPGQFIFTVAVQDGLGNGYTKQFTINVLAILTTELPEVVIGDPYSFQMLASGGSGSYGWRIVDGALAPGLQLDVSGLISGTPTGDMPETVTIRVVDTECEPIEPDFLPPNAELSGTATTKTRTWKGFNEFFGSLPLKRYKVLAWDGTVELHGPGSHNLGQLITLGYCGQTVIDINGNVTQERRMTGYSPCHADVNGNCANTEPGAPVFLTGCISGNVIAGTTYVRNFGLAPNKDWSTPNPAPERDAVWGLTFEVGYTSYPSNVQAKKEGRFTGFGVITDVDRTVDLSSEYTDADADASATFSEGDGLVAAWVGRGIGYRDFQVSIAYRLRLSNLMQGQQYVGKVRLFHSIDFTFNFATTQIIHGDGNPVSPPDDPAQSAIYFDDDADSANNDYDAKWLWNVAAQDWVIQIQTRKYAFTASAQTHTVNDTVGVPAIDRYITVSLPSIELA